MFRQQLSLSITVTEHEACEMRSDINMLDVKRDVRIFGDANDDIDEAMFVRPLILMEDLEKHVRDFCRTKQVFLSGDALEQMKEELFFCGIDKELIGMIEKFVDVKILPTEDSPSFGVFLMKFVDIASGFSEEPCNDLFVEIMHNEDNLPIERIVVKLLQLNVDFH